MQANATNLAELRPNFASLESNQGNPGLLKVIDPRPQGNGRWVGGPGVILSQCILGLPQLLIHLRQIDIKI